MFKIETVYVKGVAAINEDSYVINEEEGIYAVIDGATGLGGLSGSMASKIIAQGLMEGNGELLERVKNGNERLGKEAAFSYESLDAKSINEIPKLHRSTCGLAAIELMRDSGQNLMRMKYAAAADCIIFLLYHNGQIRQINYDYMDSLDGQGIQFEKEQWNALLTKSENPNHWSDLKINQVKNSIHEKTKPILMKNRQKLNTADGYGIIDGSEEALIYLETGTIPLVNVQKILLLTDGMKIHSRRDESIENEWIYSAELAFQFGLNYLLESILEMENNDPACYLYPRFKQHDDKTGILLTIEDV